MFRSGEFRTDAKKIEQRSVIVKFVKGAIVFLVLCLAAYGTYALFNTSPNIDVCESSFAYLEQLGIHIQDGRAEDTGLSGILGDVGGLPSIGAMSSSFDETGSSTPPSSFGNTTVPRFLTESTTSPTASLTPSPSMNAAPRVATATPEPHSVEPQAAPDFIQLPLNVSEPVDSPIQAPSPCEVQPFETVPLGRLVPPLEAPSISATESPPPWAESWDGPASGIPATPPPAKSLDSPTTPFRPIASTLADTLPPVRAQAISQPIGESIRRIENVRRIEIETESIPTPVPTVPESTVLESAVLANQEHTFSSPESIPLEMTTMSNTRYIQTASRQPLTFEPVRPEVSPTAPVVAFAPPRQLNQPPHQSNQPQSNQPRQSELLQPPFKPLHRPLVDNPVAVSPATVNPTVNRNVAPRFIENVPPPIVQSSVQPPIRETIEQFIQAQRQLAESGDPNNIRQAFSYLSQLYELEQLEDAERAMMQPILDVLALRVIYAWETHILEPPHQVKPGETIESIARDFHLTPALLRKINGLAMSQEVAVGTMLKVVHGQFDARVSIQRRELTLLLGGLYAGRFPFSLPNENIAARRGEFYVTHRTDRTLVLTNGWVLAADDVREATIAFTERDARKILDILSEKSVIVVE